MLCIFACAVPFNSLISEDRYGSYAPSFNVIAWAQPCVLRTSGMDFQLGD